jgi:hypothetical protein
VSTVLPRRFALVRQVDYTGVSGVGVVAFGIAFSDGHVVLRWCSAHTATSTWNSLEDMLAVHAPGDVTSIQWIDPPASELEDLSNTTPRGRRARRDAPPTPEPAAVTVTVQDSASNGYQRPAGRPDTSLPRQPGRHRRANQVESSV